MDFFFFLLCQSTLKGPVDIYPRGTQKSVMGKCLSIPIGTGRIQPKSTILSPSPSLPILESFPTQQSKSPMFSERCVLLCSAWMTFNATRDHGHSHSGHAPIKPSFVVVLARRIPWWLAEPRLRSTKPYFRPAGLPRRRDATLLERQTRWFLCGYILPLIKVWILMRRVEIE